jgi:hypothetical protein
MKTRITKRIALLILCLYSAPYAFFRVNWLEVLMNDINKSERENNGQFNAH